MSRPLLALIGLAYTLAVPLALGQAPAPIGLQRMLVVPGGDQVHVLHLDDSVYAASKMQNFDDVRVLNAAGEAVPLSLLPQGAAPPPDIRWPLPVTTVSPTEFIFELRPTERSFQFVQVIPPGEDVSLRVAIEVEEGLMSGSRARPVFTDRTWRTIITTNMFRFKTVGTVAESPPVALYDGPSSGARVAGSAWTSRLRLRLLDGARLDVPPTVLAVAQPVRLAFVPRGPGPYKLVVLPGVADRGPALERDVYRSVASGEALPRAVFAQSATAPPLVTQPNGAAAAPPRTADYVGTSADTNAGTNASTSTSADTTAGANAAPPSVASTPPPQAVPPASQPAAVNASTAAPATPRGTARIVFWGVLFAAMFALGAMALALVRARRGGASGGARRSVVPRTRAAPGHED